MNNFFNEYDTSSHMVCLAISITTEFAVAVITEELTVNYSPQCIIIDSSSVFLWLFIFLFFLFIRPSFS